MFKTNKGRSETIVPVKRGQALIFRSDRCHRGTAVEAGGSERIAIHAFLNPCPGEKLGVDTHGCPVYRERVTLGKLKDPQKFPHRRRGGHDEEKANKDEIDHNHKCQLCQATGMHDFSTGRLRRRAKGELDRCKTCNVTLCSSVCFEYFHRGVGLNETATSRPVRKCNVGKLPPTIEDYKMVKLAAIRQKEEEKRYKRKRASADPPPPVLDDSVPIYGLPDPK